MVQQEQPYLLESSDRGHLSGLDKLGDAAYVADCLALNRTDVLPWEALSETERQRYRAVAAALQRECTPGSERIQAFLGSLPAGIKQFADYMRSQEDGLLYPSTAIRVWQEVASRTDDGREISASPSHWTVVAWTQGRGWLGEMLHKHTGLHYECWSLHAFNSSPGPHILDYDPPLEKNLHGKQGRSAEITEQDVRDFALPYVIDYFQLHLSNHHFIEILECDHHGGHHANWFCRMKFSASGDTVKLLIHPTDRGLEVFAHRYED